MSGTNDDPNHPAEGPAHVTHENYVPGSALAAIDAKLAYLDKLFKSSCHLAARNLAVQLGSMPPPEPPKESLLKDTSLGGMVAHMKTCKNIIVLTGAGISTSAGIPDFRTPGTGLYDNVNHYLDKYGLSTPQQLFSYDLFMKDPEPFYVLCRELKYPTETIQPTAAHRFIKLLDDKGLLLRNYTQNIDMLQTATGIDEEKVFEVHGSFRSGHCVKCEAAVGKEQVKAGVMSGQVARCEEGECGGVIKPDIVMFGQRLPRDYHLLISTDEDKCDLLIIMGTSLSVGPVNSIPNSVPDTTPRFMINFEKVCIDLEAHANFNAPIFFFDHPDNKRDVFLGGDIDTSILTLVRMLGWQPEFDKL